MLTTFFLFAPQNVNSVFFTHSNDNSSYNQAGLSIVVTIEEDQKLALRSKSITNKAVTSNLTSISYNVMDNSYGYFQSRGINDPTDIDGYFIPNGTTGKVKLEITGIKNKRSATYIAEIEIVSGPAINVIIETFDPVPQ